MVGGTDAAVKHCEPIFTALAPADGYAHVGPTGAGHYVKMIHNGIEYAMLQGYAEGYEILHASKTFPKLDLAQISEVWQYGSVVRSWLNELAASAFKNDLNAVGHQGLGRRFRRGPLDRAGGDRPRRAGAGDHAVPAGALPLATDRLVRRQGHRGVAQRVRRPRGEALMSGAPVVSARQSVEIQGPVRQRCRPVHHGDLRSAWRSQSPQAAAGDLPVDEGTSRPRRFRRARRGPRRHADGRHFSLADATGARRLGRGEGR